jgi:hypothetical protein
MRVENEILAARIYGTVHCGLSVQASCTVEELAREFGLRDDAACYTEIDKLAAREVIRSILHKDLAYSPEVMTETPAEELADRFLRQFGSGTRYFTNGTWHVPAEVRANGVACGPSWTPATLATFDAGVLAVGQERSGCLWIEDED